MGLTVPNLENQTKDIVDALQCVITALGGGAATVGTSTTTIDSVTDSGTVADGYAEYSIVNVGGASGTVDGEPFPVGAGITAQSYYDPVANQFKRPTGLPYDATGTTFLIQTNS